MVLHRPTTPNAISCNVPYMTGYTTRRVAFQTPGVHHPATLYQVYHTPCGVMLYTRYDTPKIHAPPKCRTGTQRRSYRSFVVNSNLARQPRPIQANTTLYLTLTLTPTLWGARGRQGQSRDSAACLECGSFFSPVIAPPRVCHLIRECVLSNPT